jgi:hypothetical protein
MVAGAPVSMLAIAVTNAGDISIVSVDACAAGAIAAIPSRTRPALISLMLAWAAGCSSSPYLAIGVLKP